MLMFRTAKTSLVLLSTCAPLLLGTAAGAETAADPKSASMSTRAGADALFDSFRAPPQQALPRAWWHWMNGNVTKEGIQADLKWMHRVGIGGAHQFDAGGVLADYKLIEPRVVVDDDNWRSAIKTAAETTDRLGLEFTTAASRGWSETGGPWVSPAQAMKKYVWSETIVDGGRLYTGRLPAPKSATGVFQNAPPRDWLGSKDQAPPQFYADALVVAYRLPALEQPELAPISVRASSGELEAPKLRDGDFSVTQAISASSEDAKTLWIEAVFARPVTIRGVSLGFSGHGWSPTAPIQPVLEVSDDGNNWRSGASLSGPADAGGKTYSFSPLTARFFRLVLPELPPPGLAESMFGPPRPKGPHLLLSELTFHTEAMINRFAEKAGFGEPIPVAQVPTPDVDRRAAIARSDVVDLTGKIAADGTLKWQVPAGRWRVIRLGYSLTGQRNAPAPEEATGLEVDKFSPKHIRAYLDEYLRRFEAGTGPELIGRRGLRYLLTDSWEAGFQNWTDEMPAEFKKRRGYDITPWLPVLTGRVVESSTASERFLWDFRRTIQDLIAQHYQVLREELSLRGMGLYVEAQGDTWRALADGMEIKSRGDIPMAEYWFNALASGAGQPTLKADMKEAASVAHLYGKPFAATESLTVASRTPWAFAPSRMKPVIDEIFAHGINRIVLHSSVHQPDLKRKPGLTLGLFGQYLNRNETWAEQAAPFISYISRASHLLQQGRYVADIAYFYGEDRPLVSLFKGRADPKNERLLIEVPTGYGYDFINAETLKSITRVEAGHLSTAAGMRYSVLYLGPDTKAMTLPALQRIEQLVQGGVTLVGERPKTALGLRATDAQLRQIADRIWGASPANGIRSVGSGRVISGISLPDALKLAGVEPDVEFRGSPDAYFLQLHRRTEDGRDIYFVNNRLDRTEATEAVFRTTGRVPELWDAVAGSKKPVSYRVEGGRTIVPLQLGAKEFDLHRLRRTD